MFDIIWNEIIKYLDNNRSLRLLSNNTKAQGFTVSELNSDYIIVQFNISKNKLKLEKIRFEAAYELLKKNRGNYIPIGASRNNTNANTLEGEIKNKFNGKLNGLSTAPWIATILVSSFENIIFNEKKKGQAIKLV